MKRCLSLLLALALLLACTLVIPFQTNAAVVASGTCGDNLTWTLDNEGTLTISGTGETSEYHSSSMPWRDYRSVIKRVIIEEGVTRIGERAFSGCSNLTSVTIPDSFRSTGPYAFDGCSRLSGVYITDIAAWCKISFYYNGYYSTSFSSSPLDYAKNLYLNGELITDLVIPNGVTSIGNCAFMSCSSLSSVTIPDSVTQIGTRTFWNCSNLTDVYYAGTMAQWKEILTGSDNKYLTNATIHTTESEPVLIGITVKDVPIKTEYLLGEALDLTGLVLTGRFSNSSIAEITEGYTVSGFDSATVGAKTVTVTYEGFTATFTVTVSEPKTCEHLETATQYRTLEEALAATASGTIKLLMDTTVNTVMLKPGVTLDLNGHTLTAESVVVFNGATILDGGTDCIGGGLLKVAEDNLGFMRENGQGVIPVWNGTDGYVFTKVAVQQMTNTAGEGAAQYIFLPTFSNADAAALMADGGTDNGLKIKVCLTWAGGQSQQFYTYSDNFVAQVFDGTNRYAFDLKVTGIAGIDDMTANAVVVTDTGVQATASGTALVAG